MSKYDAQLETDIKTFSGKILNLIKKNAKILEFGSASGRFTKYFKEYIDCKVHIVEINEVDFRKAMQYAEDGICSNIDTMEWVDYFKDNKYDYIIFTDVLEHLREPQKVFNACADFLKDDGSILFSIPNVSHGDILANIYNNDFKYTELGLLDNTHIHLFGYENILQMIEQSPLQLVSIDAVYVPLKYTEQNANYYNDLLFNILNEKEYSTVYQFIGECKKISDKKMLNKISEVNEYMFAKVYYSHDMSFTEDNSRIINVIKRGIYTYTCTISIPKDYEYIRFDPIEDKYIKLMLKDIKGYNGKIIHNGIDTSDGIIFGNTDPVLHLDIKNCADTEIVIEYDMKIFQYREICSVISEYNDAVKDTIEVLNHEINLLNSDMSLLNDTIKNKDIELNKCNEAIIKMNENFNQEKDKLNKELQLKDKELNNSNQEKTELNNLLVEKEQILAKCNEEMIKMNESFNQEKDKLNKELQLKDKELNNSNQEKTELNNLLVERDQVLAKCNEEMIKMNESFNQEKDSLNKALQLIHEELHKKNNEYNQLQQESSVVIQENNKQIIYLESCISNNMTEIEELKKLIESIYNSRSWRFTKPMRMMMEKFKIFGKYRGGGKC